MAAAESIPSAKPAPVVIKKYANRRLYNTSTSMYVTLDHLAQMVKDKTDFVVYDAKSGDDITRSVLTQIIFEEESKGQNLLPISFLRQLIGFYGDNLQALVPQYLEMSMQSFAKNQEQMRKAMQGAFGFNPFAQMEQQTRQSMAMFEQAMKMFNPFMAAVPGMGAQGAAPQATPDSNATPPVAPVAPPPAERPREGGGDTQALDDLRRKLEELQSQLSQISTRREG
ncbi:polyhydroxyalkanoate synthesis repressor PhaR [Reyranella sp. CPCC 100927]|uniref:polyhydroxyalkanoate synthesis repressor PhaR n=1 Tax=Reyranella sp. CPCC 100927 TaxID=2599616 RepID=UPI0011B41C51|nr:polyhydroxyalkanoate synthesis repressor PhaR [Reyranella sp. CPCC 100927]TWS97341.1 polyhydroxyalkanoate synthesis repressor PhaR [Reyranella sp. CPCC 100927]